MSNLIFDGHIHIMDVKELAKECFIRSSTENGIAGGIIISPPPQNFGNTVTEDDYAVRIADVLRFCAGEKNYYPFFWIDPIAGNAAEQVSQAIAGGVAGFKIICDRFLPSDPVAMATYRRIAEQNKPILFHSGILWDGKASSKNNRPCEFENLLEIPRLRFALAHIAWPWCDELIALYGKFLHAARRHPDITPEMFIDTTPGTPPIYRREALTKVFTIGYNVADNVFWGSDTTPEDYHPVSLNEDIAILNDLGVNEQSIECYCSQNLQRFVLGFAPSSR